MSRVCVCVHHLSELLNRLLTPFSLHNQEGKHEGDSCYIYVHISMVICTPRSLMCASMKFILRCWDLMGNQVEIASVENKYQRKNIISVMRICSYRKRSEIEFPSLSTGRLNYANMRIHLEKLSAVGRTKPLLQVFLRFPVEKK